MHQSLLIQEENTQCPNSSHSTTVVCSYRSSLATTRPGVLYTQGGTCMYLVTRAQRYIIIFKPIYSVYCLMIFMEEEVWLG